MIDSEGVDYVDHPTGHHHDLTEDERKELRVISEEASAALDGGKVLPKGSDMTELEAGQRLTRLRIDYGLGFTHNPGGGEFSHPEHGRCQVSMQNYVDDLAKVEKWIAGWPR